VANYLSTRNELKQATDSNDIAEIRARLDARRNDVRIQLQEDMIVFPVAAWIFLFVWDKIMDKMYPELVWTVSDLGSLSLLVPCVLAYLFGLPIRNKFK
jgi:hypothetical protein